MRKFHVKDKGIFATTYTIYADTVEVIDSLIIFTVNLSGLLTKIVAIFPQSCKAVEIGESDTIYFKPGN